MAKDYFFKLVKTRKTCYEFSEKRVKDKDLKKILEAARWAPSYLNIQPWHFIVIKNKSRISELINGASWGVFHTDPQVIIALVITDTRRRDVDAKMCIGMAGLIMTLEAKELGIDTCMLTPDRINAAKILKLKEEYEMDLMIGIGYEQKNAFQKERVRKALKTIVSYEKFKKGKS